MAGGKAEKPPNFERKPFPLFLRLHVAESAEEDAIRESILEEKIQEIYSQNRR